MNYLLDTCVISEVHRKQPAKEVILWLEQTNERTLFLSVLTLGEIQKGISRLPAGRKRQRLQNWLQTDLQERFRDRILPVNEEVALEWGRLQAEAEDQGRPLPAIDSLLAATARIYRLTVVTRNNSDLEAGGVPILNPWSPES